MTALLPRLALLLLLAAPAARGAWLEGIRWFRHENFLRLVFDLSEPVAYRINPKLEQGHVDVELRGGLDSRAAAELAIGEAGVLSAAQLRRTPSGLTWRVLTQGIARVRHMSVDEQPYKVALDFYPSAAAASPAAALPAAATSAPAREPRTQPAASSGEKTVTGDLPAPAQRYEGLKPDNRRRLQVGELLMQLGDSAGAAVYLEQVHGQEPAHPWTRVLLAQVALGRGDEYRAAQLLEPLRTQTRWRPLVDPLLKRLHPPDEKGQVPGGEIREEDLSYFIGVLRQGAGLSAGEVYPRPEPVRETGSARGLLPGIAIGAVLGLLAFAVDAWRRRRKHDQMVRDRIMTGRDEPRGALLRDEGEPPPDYAAVAQRVRQELDGALREESPPPRSEEPARYFDTPAPPQGLAGEDPLEERVYRLADQKKSIVEIAEELNLGVDEVRLHLELREQAGRIANA